LFKIGPILESLWKILLGGNEAGFEEEI
jgi:hypothetical protein